MQFTKRLRLSLIKYVNEIPNDTYCLIKVHCSHITLAGFSSKFEHILRLIYIREIASNVYIPLWL